MLFYHIVTISLQLFIIYDNHIWLLSGQLLLFFLMVVKFLHDIFIASLIEDYSLPYAFHNIFLCEFCITFCICTWRTAILCFSVILAILAKIFMEVLYYMQFLSTMSVIWALFPLFNALIHDQKYFPCLVVHIHLTYQCIYVCYYTFSATMLNIF